MLGIVGQIGLLLLAVLTLLNTITQVRYSPGLVLSFAVVDKTQHRYFL